MKTWRADLHIHSRFSRATSGRLTVPHLAAWAGAKGIDLLATGDFTHPAWREELREALEPDEQSGFYRLKKPLGADDVEREIPSLAGMAPAPPRFVLEAEISSIYKKNGAVRKVHSLVYVPDFDAAEKLSVRLAAVGNLNSDGRPILGLDVKHLLEMVLEIPRAYMIPAHIWTPWFSLFGSKSGFDSLHECFEDLTPHIFAAETGLSSDPDMNRCWSHLDHLSMVSSSDAHSGENLAREATLFSGEFSYDGMFAALKGENADYAGTLEFFPDEGKYHLDGHRACNVMLEPLECMKLNDMCPVCGKPLTIGVLHRVLELADRTAPPEPGKGFRSLIPLAEILGELLHCGPRTRKPQLKLAELALRFGSELDLLMETPLPEVSAYWPELGEALRRMRAGEVIRRGGYDGEYGVIRLFEPGEMEPSLLERVPRARRRPLPSGQGDLLGGLAAMQEKKENGAGRPARRSGSSAAGTVAEASSRPAFSEAQEQALRAGLEPPRPVLVLAGPGAGKTRTLAGRALHLLEHGVPASDMAAVTFTRRAAGELRERLTLFMRAAGMGGEVPEADTLHALALRRWVGAAPLLLPEEAARKAFAARAPQWKGREAARAWTAFSLARERMEVNGLPAEIRSAAEDYQTWKTERGLADYADLLEKWLAALGSGETPPPWRHVLVDEAQDLSPLQLALLRALLPSDGAGFFGIGDPDQAIYSFRGAEADVETSLRVMWPDIETLTLDKSYRAAQAVLDAGRACLLRAPDGRAACGELRGLPGARATLQWLSAPSVEYELGWVAGRVAYLLGGTSHQQADMHEELAGCHLASGSCSPGDIAVLVRLKSLMPPLRAALEARGIPCSVPEEDAFWTEPGVEALLRAALLRLRGANGTEGGSDAVQADAEMHGAEDDDDAARLLAALPEKVWELGPRGVVKSLEAEREAALAAGNPDADPLPEEIARLAAPLFTESAAFRALEKSFAEAGRDWEKLLASVALLRDLDMARARAERVQIMTMHAAKGLEFRAVFLPCLEDGILPFYGLEYAEGEPPADTREKAELLREEARILYVGITRAAEAVFTSFAAERKIYGRSVSSGASPLFAPDLFRAILPTRRVRRRASQLSF